MVLLIKSINWYTMDHNTEDIVANLINIKWRCTLTINLLIKLPENQTAGTGISVTIHWRTPEEQLLPRDISHTYEKVGKYVVTLIATGECGKAGSSQICDN